MKNRQNLFIEKASGELVWSNRCFGGFKMKKTITICTLAAALSLGLSGCRNNEAYRFNGMIDEEKVEYTPKGQNDYGVSDERNSLKIIREDGKIITWELNEEDQLLRWCVGDNCYLKNKEQDQEIFRIAESKLREYQSKILTEKKKQAKEKADQAYEKLVNQK